MPQFLQNIDQIARAKQRDVLCLEFFSHVGDYSANPMREKILAWLDQKVIAYRECGGYASETRMESYRGQIYIDLPYDLQDPVYLALEAYLEDADSTMRWEGVRFTLYTLGYCMKNAHHDAPGFWDQWADAF
ncbi:MULTISPECIES: hypothetical protein [unclassified Janthinobacterium]|uniref:hypothetical protein n=1 Tax=unclassified Janthinobacterium TaxID=2610881 RepID=UPI00160C00EC|nr:MULTISPECIES: hypothetical protein [unclassified Janthinobacterium]MBB5371074.1 hypothetical protein [Janthinobacterium sp. K2C7]MBB5383880.1 hypothetical protein [Janthinobacterium sp. K2Li3]MBB5389298.1 hypothetical protein [Janthinobacterium sp. K2E3]